MFVGPYLPRFLILVSYAFLNPVTKFVLQPYLLPKSATDSVIPDVDGKEPSGDSTTAVKVVAEPIWSIGTELAIDVYISSSSETSDLFSKARGPSSEETTLAHISWGKVKRGDWDIEKSWTGTVDLPTVRWLVTYLLSIE
jgi:hypothetical protein